MGQCQGYRREVKSICLWVFGVLSTDNGFVSASLPTCAWFSLDSPIIAHEFNELSRPFGFVLRALTASGGRLAVYACSACAKPYTFCVRFGTESGTRATHTVHMQIVRFRRDATRKQWRANRQLCASVLRWRGRRA